MAALVNDDRDVAVSALSTTLNENYSHLIVPNDGVLCNKCDKYDDGLSRLLFAQCREYITLNVPFFETSLSAGYPWVIPGFQHGSPQVYPHAVSGWNGSKPVIQYLSDAYPMLAHVLMHKFIHKQELATAAVYSAGRMWWRSRLLAALA